MTKFQYCVERVRIDRGNSYEKVNHVFFKNSDEAMKYARHIKELFPLYRVTITLFREVK